VSLARFIAAQRTGHGVPHAVACRALSVSRAWFYKWRDGDCSTRRARRAELAAAVKRVFVQSRRRYGSPRIAGQLRREGRRVSVNTVAALMREQQLVARRRRRWRSITKRDRSGRKAPDLVNRDFSPPPAPNVTWCGDVKEVATLDGKLYLAHVLDLHSRRVVGFALGEHHDAELTRAVLCMAIAVRGGDVAGVIMHTDQGGEYTGGLFARACTGLGIRQSMGSVADALDNAASESWHSSIEFELMAEREPFPTKPEARRAVAEYIEWYNADRLHSTNAMSPPIEHELAQQPATREAA
jgi:putative transposase